MTSRVSPLPHDPPTTNIAFLTRAYCRIHHHRRDRCLRRSRAQGNRWAPLRGLLCGAHRGAQDEGIGLKAFHRKFGRPEMESEMEGWWWLMMGDDGFWWPCSRQNHIIFVWLMFKRNTRELGTWIFVRLWHCNLKSMHLESLFMLIHIPTSTFFTSKMFEIPQGVPSTPSLHSPAVPPSHLGLSPSPTLPRPIAKVVPDHKHQWLWLQLPMDAGPVRHGEDPPVPRTMGGPWDEF